MDTTETVQTVSSIWVTVAQQFGVGAGLFYGVVKFFDLIGGRLDEDTNLEIAVWLLGIKSPKIIQGWPSTFSALFYRVFGAKHFSLKCFVRSATVSIITALVIVVASLSFITKIRLAVAFEDIFWLLMICCVLQFCFADYVSIL